MPFRVKDVLIVNATVIIGLLILLTFQSISSSFIETETSDFNKKWRDIMMFEDVNWELQRNCKLLNDDRAAYEDWFVDLHTEYDEDGSISFRAYDHLSKEMENEIKKRCSELVVEGLETFQRLKEVAFYLWSRSPRRNLQRFTSIGSREYVADPFQVWCLSTGRVGSKTLAELANLSGKVAAVHEPWPKTFGLSRLSYEYGKDSACQQVFVESVTAVLEKIISEVENLHFIETSPQCTFLAPAARAESCMAFLSTGVDPVGTHIKILGFAKALFL